MAKPVNDEQANQLANTIIDDEYRVGRANNNIPDNDYLDYLDMFDCERTEKNYDWMSDIYFPEFTSQMLTQSAIEAGLYFRTHDFVEVYIGSEQEVHKNAAKVNKDLINKTLNRRQLWFYQKYMRAINMKNISGVAYFRCWWEQDTRMEKIGTRRVREQIGTDINGSPIEQFTDQDVEVDVVLKDHFNFDVIDPRDVFTDPSYVYSLQDKQWIILRFDTTVDELEANADTMEYFNLDKLRTDSGNTPRETDTKGDKTTHHGLDNKSNAIKTPLKSLMVLQRLGKHWVMVGNEEGDRDPNGNPVNVTSGIGNDGQKKEGAELHEMVITFAMDGFNSSTRTLIGYHPARDIDSMGNPYRPVTRGLCYMHPAKDDGMGDGKCLRELQIGINDTINMENDRTKLATIPIMQGNQHDISDNETLVWQPGAFWQTETGDKLDEVQIDSNVVGALNQVNLYQNMMQQASGVSAETQSKLAAPTTTATATVNQVRRSDTRSAYRTLTMENTGLTDIFWFITQMSARHMRDETAEKMLGEEGMISFDPTLDFTYKPISASIDDDSSKQTKIQNWIQVLSFIASDPERRDAIDYILGELASLMGKEFEAFGNKFFANTKAPPMAGGGGNMQPQGAAGAVPSNQSGMEQSPEEVQVREAANAI
tara:strand:+ start:2265 stop:4220 length:1956 start_codon:yes stop_codon:yes gene_type:complete